MTTQSLRSTVLRLPKLLTVATVMAFAVSLGSTQAQPAPVEAQRGALSDAQAKGAADYIMSLPAALRYNGAITVVKNLTFNTGSGYAAVNAKLIAKYIPEGQQVALVPAIIKGIAFNYPNQLGTVTAQLILLNETTRGHADRILAQIAALAGSNSEQMSVVINILMRDHSEILKKAGVISAMLFSSINSSAIGTPEDRAEQIGVAAANLLAGVLTADKCGATSKVGQKAFRQVSLMLSLFMQTIPTGNLTREQVVFYVAGNFAATLRNSQPPGTPAATVNTILNQATAAIIQQLLASGSTPAIIQQVNNAVVVAQNLPTGQNFPTGPVTPPVTPH